MFTIFPYIPPSRAPHWTSHWTSSSWARLTRCITWFGSSWPAESPERRSSWVASRKALRWRWTAGFGNDLEMGENMSKRFFFLMMFHGSLYDPCLFDSMFNNYCRCLILNMTSFTNVVGPVGLPCLSQRSRIFDAFSPGLRDRREADYFIGSVGFESKESYQMQHWFWSISRFWRNTDSNASRISWFLHGRN